MYHNHNNSSIFGTKIQILNDFTFNQTQLFWHSMSEHCSVSHPKLVGTSYIYKKASEKDCREIKIQLSHYSHNCIFMRVEWRIFAYSGEQNLTCLLSRKMTECHASFMYKWLECSVQPSMITSAQKKMCSRCSLLIGLSRHTKKE